MGPPPILPKGTTVTVRFGVDILSMLQESMLLAAAETKITNADQFVAMRNRFRNSKEGAAIRAFLLVREGRPTNDDSYMLCCNMEVVSFDVGQVLVELSAPKILVHGW
jgi:hypothetical protein